MRPFDLQVPFFRPLWIRVATVATCLGWSAFEFAGGTPFWGVLFGVLGLWCAHEFFVAFAPVDPPARAEGSTEAPTDGKSGPDGKR